MSVSFPSSGSSFSSGTPFLEGGIKEEDVLHFCSEESCYSSGASGGHIHEDLRRKNLHDVLNFSIEFLKKRLPRSFNEEDALHFVSFLQRFSQEEGKSFSSLFEEPIFRENVESLLLLSLSQIMPKEAEQLVSQMQGEGSLSFIRTSVAATVFIEGLLSNENLNVRKEPFFSFLEGFKTSPSFPVLAKLSSSEAAAFFIELYLSPEDKLTVELKNYVLVNVARNPSVEIFPLFASWVKDMHYEARSRILVGLAHNPSAEAIRSFGGDDPTALVEGLHHEHWARILQGLAHNVSPEAVQAFAERFPRKEEGLDVQQRSRILVGLARNPSVAIQVAFAEIYSTLAEGIGAAQRTQIQTALARNPSVQAVTIFIEKYSIEKEKDAEHCVRVRIALAQNLSPQAIESFPLETFPRTKDFNRERRCKVMEALAQNSSPEAVLAFMRRHPDLAKGLKKEERTCVMVALARSSSSEVVRHFIEEYPDLIKNLKQEHRFRILLALAANPSTDVVCYFAEIAPKLMNGLKKDRRGPILRVLGSCQTPEKIDNFVQAYPWMKQNVDKLPHTHMMRTLSPKEREEFQALCTSLAESSELTHAGDRPRSGRGRSLSMEDVHSGSGA